MARSIIGWERLKPSIGESGKPGSRLLSHDGEAQQTAVYRKNEGPWKDAAVYCEWLRHDDSWRLHMLDAHGRFYGPIWDLHFQPAVNKFSEMLTDRGLPPIN